MSNTTRKIIQIGTDKAIVVYETRAKHQKIREWNRGKKLRPYILAKEPYKGRYKRGEHHPVGADKNFGRLMGNTRMSPPNLKMRMQTAALKRALGRQLRGNLKTNLRSFKKNYHAIHTT